MSLPSELLPVGLLGTGATGGYEIERSLRFNSADSAYLSRTPASAGNRKTWTYSFWLKRVTLGGTQSFLFAGPNGSGDSYVFLSDNFAIGTYGSGGWTWLLQSSAVFRDTSAWYHFVASIDTTQATASDRAKIYVNGQQITAFSTSTYPSQNFEGQINNNTYQNKIGADAVVRYSSGYLADVHFIDGQALDPTSFGEFDENGIWQPIAYDGEYGTNGFHLDFSDNSAATATTLGADSSGNGNNWTPNNLSVSTSTTRPAVNFDGNGDSLSLSLASGGFGSGDFTLEYFVYHRTLTDYQTHFGVTRGSTGFNVGTDASGDFVFYDQVGSAGRKIEVVGAITTGRWYHWAFVRSGSTITGYLDGVAKGTYSSSANYSGTTCRIGDLETGGESMNGLISNFHIVVGTALYTSNFTPPTPPISSVANTKLLCCQSSSSATTATVTPGTITANGDAFATSFTDSSAGNDSLVDVPQNGTQTDTGLGGEVRGNYCTLNPLDNGGATLANGNLEQTYASAAWRSVRGTIGVNSGKWYWEGIFTAGGTANADGIGFALSTASLTSYAGNTGSWGYLQGGVTRANGGSSASYGSSYTTGDIIGIALDLNAGTCTFYKNGTSQGQAFSGLSGTFFPFSDSYDNSKWILNFGQRPFAYPAPSGFKALNTANLPTPTILDGSDYMDVLTYTGNGSTQTISGLEFSPDLVWLKARSAAYGNYLSDTVRGITKDLYSHATNAEYEEPTLNGITAVTSNGFSLGNDIGRNNNTTTYVAWTWDAGSSTVENTDGSITSSVRANPSAGFSIVTYTGTGANATVGHGLNAAPSFIIIKNRDTSLSDAWRVWHSSLAANERLVLSGTNAVGSSPTLWQNTRPSSALFYLDNDARYNTSGDSHVAYCFAPVEGYSAFGSYTGNGSADGPFIFTGHRPRWILIKSASVAPTDWLIYDTARDTYNALDNFLQPNTSSAEGTYVLIDALSNGFKIRNTGANGSGETIIYASFAENPFSVARAR